MIVFYLQIAFLYLEIACGNNEPRKITLNPLQTLFLLRKPIHQHA